MRRCWRLVPVAVMFLLLPAAAHADQSKMVFLRSAPFEVQGIGDAHSPQFTTTGDFEFCWGMTDAGDPFDTPTTYRGPYTGFFLHSSVITQETTVKERATSSGGPATTTERTTSSSTTAQNETSLLVNNQLNKGNDSGCALQHFDPGTYSIHVVAPDSTAWWFRIEPA